MHNNCCCLSCGLFFFHVHQVLENDLRKKISAVQKLHEQARGYLTDFTFQRKQLEDYISQMSAWLKSMEDSLDSSPAGSDPEEICRVKVHVEITRVQQVSALITSLLDCWLSVQGGSQTNLRLMECFSGSPERSSEPAGQHWLHPGGSQHPVQKIPLRGTG